MKLFEALGVLGIDNINTLSIDQLKRIYKDKIKANHPDLGGCVNKAKDINNAYSIVMKSVKYINILDSQNPAEAKCIISFSDLYKIYDGEEIHFKYSGEERVLNKKTLRLTKVILDVNVSIQFKGVQYKFSNLQFANINDIYSINCVVYDKDIRNPGRLIVEAYDKKVESELNGKSIIVPLRFSNNIRLRVNVERGLKDE